MTTKLHLLAEGHCRPLALVLSPGHWHDSTQLAAVLDAVCVPQRAGGAPRKRPEQVVGDKGYSYRRCRRELRRRGMRHVIPERRDQRQQRRAKGRRGGRPPRFDRVVYRRRNEVERCIARLKQFRRVATRYDKLADSYLAFVHLAAILIWLR